MCICRLLGWRALAIGVLLQLLPAMSFFDSLECQKFCGHLNLAFQGVLCPPDRLPLLLGGVQIMNMLRCHSNQPSCCEAHDQLTN